MRIILLVAMIMFSFGCAIHKPAFHSQMVEPVYIDYTHTWANKPFANSDISSITIRLINKKYTKVAVDLICTAKEKVVGKSTVSVRPRNDVFATVMVGFATGKIECFIQKYKDIN
jgi:hypothetical protein